jgi:uncharacterized membrane protein YfcA
LPITLQLVIFMNNFSEVSAHYRKTATNLLAVAFLASGMALVMYLGAFP